MSSKAHELAKKQRDISIAEFFEKNRHLLGFDNKKKSLLTTIKEAVDNALDACDESEILPEIIVEVIDMGNDRFKVIIEDNGPGIIKAQIPKIFAKLLYGSKFHKLSQTRGQQGIGISAAVLYSQLTTGKPAKITSKISSKDDAHYYELMIDTKTNKPSIVREDTVQWKKERGTRIELDLEGSYSKGDQSVDQYLKQTAVVNPHVTIMYTNPKAEQIIFPRAINETPVTPKEIKPHPYGVELGRLQRMMEDSSAKTVQSFLMNEFSRVSSAVAKQICENAAILPNTKPKDITREMCEKLMKGIQKTKIMAPPTNCLSPIGEEAFEKGLRKEINAEFYCSSMRPPAVYRGNPFIVEVALAYGGHQPADSSAKLFRYANRVPLLYQQSACAMTRTVSSTAWRNYGLSQSQGAMPVGPLTIALHISSVWVPFTSESKEAIAPYPEIIKEVKLALQECGRKLGLYVHKKKRIQQEGKKRDYIQKYIPHVAETIKEILSLKKEDEEKMKELLKDILEKTRGEIKDIADKNTEYDEEFAKIGKQEKAMQTTLETEDEENGK